MRTLSLSRSLALLAIVAGGLAPFAGSPYPVSSFREVDPVELAGWIKDRKPDLRVIDVRSEADFDEYHLPTAERIPFPSLAAASISPGDTLVIYAEGDAPTLRASLLPQGAGRDHVYALRGGASAWWNDVMNPTIASTAAPEARAAFEKLAELSRYFGGMPRTIDAAAAATGSAPASRPTRRGC